MLGQMVAAPSSTASFQGKASDQQMVREMCVIRLQDSWARFCRELVLLSCWAEPVTAQGKRVTRVPNIRRAHDVIPTLISTYRRRRTEPSWHIPNDCIEAAGRLQIANYSTVKSGLGLSFSHSPTYQLRCLRNHFAHRNEVTAKLVRQLAIDLGIPTATVANLLPVSIVQPGTSLFSLWILRLRTMAQLAIQ